MAPFSSLLTFETPRGRSPVPPPTAHLVGTSTHPAPSNFLPLHFAREFLTSSDRARVIWIGCDGSGESHYRNALKKNGVNAGKGALVYIDALEEILGQAGGGELSQDAGLDRLHARVEEQLVAVTLHSEEEDGEGAPCLVVMDDASALAWSISALDQAPCSEEKETGRVDRRLQVLRSKRRGAIQSDVVGVQLAKWIEERLRRSCDASAAVLLTHLTAESTTIVPPAPHTRPTRGGSYGVGTGFDADDAGEENEEEELYEDVDEQVGDEPSKTEDGDAKRGGEYGGASGHTDWRVDSLLRRLLLNADLWVEVRGLRSGKARDCHGEVCIHSLFRPCMAQQKALPQLPLPSDPLRSLRSKDRISHPLANLNSLSLSSASSHSSIGRGWKMEITCAGRERAMLFRAEAVGEAVAWSRGGS